MKKHVLVLGYTYTAPFEDINNNYIKLFDRSEYHVTLAYLRGEFKQRVVDKAKADETIFFAVTRGSMRGLKLSAIWQLWQLYRKRRFEIMLCNRYKGMYIATLATLFTRKPNIFCVLHDTGALKNITRKLFVLLTRCKKIIFVGVSEAVRRDIMQHAWGLSDQYTLALPNVLDIPTLEANLLPRQQARTQLGLKADDFVFANTGRLAERKGQQTLIKAFSQIKPQCPTAKLMIIGEGEQLPVLQQLINDLRLTDHVLLPGFVADVYRIGTAFDVFVMSSYAEPFGVVTLEAMLAKLPIIATTVGGIPEVMGDTGISIPANDIDSMAQAMLQVYKMPPQQRQAIGQAGYQRLIQHFSIDSLRQVFWGYTTRD